jgi:hypothetical protein
MNALRLVTFLALSIGWFVASPADAAPIGFPDDCVTTTVADLVGTTCAIGRRAFNFTGFNPTGTDLDPALITFTPDASDPFTIAFTLSSESFSLASSMLQESWRYRSGELYFTVTDLPGAFYIGSFDVTLNDAVATSDPVIRNNFAPNAFVSGMLSLDTGENFFGRCDAMAMVGSNTDGPNIINQTCGSVLREGTSGFAFLMVSAFGGVTSTSMSSLTYTMHQQPTRPVPETSSLMLSSAGIALIGLWGFRVRHPTRSWHSSREVS